MRDVLDVCKGIAYVGKHCVQIAVGERIITTSFAGILGQHACAMMKFEDGFRTVYIAVEKKKRDPKESELDRLMKTV